jgi:hypothetical protein
MAQSAFWLMATMAWRKYVAAASALISAKARKRLMVMAKFVVKIIRGENLKARKPAAEIIQPSGNLKANLKMRRLKKTRITDNITSAWPSMKAKRGENGWRRPAYQSSKLAANTAARMKAMAVEEIRRRNWPASAAAALWQ